MRAASTQQSVDRNHTWYSVELLPSNTGKVPGTKVVHRHVAPLQGRCKTWHFESEFTPPWRRTLGSKPRVWARGSDTDFLNQSQLYSNELWMYSPCALTLKPRPSFLMRPQVRPFKTWMNDLTSSITDMCCFDLQVLAIATIENHPDRRRLNKPKSPTPSAGLLIVPSPGTHNSQKNWCIENKKHMM